jgi:linoleoyl-CoA desaturase
MNLRTVRYASRDADFISTLKKRVAQYFSDNQISRYGNREMRIKTVFMLMLFLVPFALMLSGIISQWWMALLMYAMMGMGMAGIGLSVMHDANHGAYSQNQKVNLWLGRTLNFLGGTATNWKIQHNVLHHTYTNIDGMDEDIDPGSMLRFSPHRPWKRWHRYQHIYGWFLYSLMTMKWITTMDFSQAKRYNEMGLVATQRTTYRKLLREVVMSKAFYFTYIIGLPLLLSSAPWWTALVGLLVLQVVAGFILAIIFQPAHVMPPANFPLPDDNGNIENNWAIHQMLTTCNFAPKKKVFSWFVGGLNFQVEHHLFPNICHVHYRNIAPIVKQTAEEFGVPYHSFSTFRGALKNHGRMLKSLGRRQALAA